MISIDNILNCMSEEKNYFGDMWERCVDVNKKRYNRVKFRNALEKMENLGYVKKYGHKNDAYYKKTPLQTVLGNMV